MHSVRDVPPGSVWVHGERRCVPVMEAVTGFLKKIEGLSSGIDQAMARKIAGVALGFPFNDVDFNKMMADYVRIGQPGQPKPPFPAKPEGVKRLTDENVMGMVNCITSGFELRAFGVHVLRLRQTNVDRHINNYPTNIASAASGVLSEWVRSQTDREKAFNILWDNLGKAYKNEKTQIEYDFVNKITDVFKKV